MSTTQIRSSKANIEQAGAAAATQTTDKPKRVVVRKPAAERLADLQAKLATFEEDKAKERAALEAAIAKLRNKVTAVTPDEADELLSGYGSLEEAEQAAEQAAAHLRRVRLAIKVKTSQPDVTTSDDEGGEQTEGEDA